MNATTYPTDAVLEATQDTEGISGHPRGLTTLFFTELWERFSYYGMRAILVLYIIAPVKLLGIMMGVWFLAAALGNKLAGYLGGFFVADNPQVLVKLYGSIALGLLVSMGVLALLTPMIRRLMGKVS